MRASRLTTLTAAGSVLLAAALGAAYVQLQSELALAQASDSLVDVAGAVVLAIAVRIAAQPRDEDHPMGHGRAEPLGALAIAALAGMLALEVGRSAVNALLGDAEPNLTGWLLALFVAKIVFKAVVLGFARGGESPALRALAVDARNDLLVGTAAVAGFFAARLGATSLDAWLTLPLALYIAWSGLQLARENLKLLMGSAPNLGRQHALLGLAAAESGVLDAHDLQAQWIGTELQLLVHITVRADHTLAEAHEIAEGVRRRLEHEPDVALCSVHVDPDQ